MSPVSSSGGYNDLFSWASLSPQVLAPDGSPQTRIQGRSDLESSWLRSVLPASKRGLGCAAAVSWTFPPLCLHNGMDSSSSVAQSCPTLCHPMNRSTPGLPVHHQLPEFTQTHVYQDGDAIQPSHPLSSPSPPAPNPSQPRGPSNEHPGLISFRMDWLDLLAVQGALKGTL